MYYLTDFGESQAFGPTITTDYQTLSIFLYILYMIELRGTPYYFSPEL